MGIENDHKEVLDRIRKHLMDKIGRYIDELLSEESAKETPRQNGIPKQEVANDWRKKLPEMKCTIKAERRVTIGKLGDCVVATCNKCGHEEMAWGLGDKSIRFAMGKMAENCPNKEAEKYYYVPAEGE